MLKRKRDDSSHSAVGSRGVNGQLSNRQKRAAEKIYHSKKTLQRALKVAKGFERQKLGRRQKTATQKKDDGDLGRIAGEIEALKILDLVSTAEFYLNKTLLRAKDIAASPALPPNVNAERKTPQSADALNVAARLFNSNPVKEVLREALPSIRQALGLEQEHHTYPEDKPGQRGRLAKNSRKTSRDASIPLPSSASSTESRELPSKKEYRRREPVDRGNNDDQIEDESEDEPSQALQALVANSSEDDMLSEDMAIDFELRKNESRGRHSISRSTTGSISPSPQNRKQQSRNGARSSNSKFIPSLTMGGYWSGSESGSEAEELVEDLAPRKNRRGQRARQKIWEQKYGHKAKHLKEDKAAGQGGLKDKRDDGWDAKRGAQANESGARKPHALRWQGEAKLARVAGQGSASGGNATDVIPRTGKSSKLPPGGLHPSWEAAKKAKEQRQLAGATFVGKKMVFD